MVVRGSQEQDREEVRGGRGGTPPDPLPGWIVCHSPGMNAVIDQVRRLANHDVNVLVRGETGTGKELVVRLIHYLSARRGRSFVPVNAGSLPDSLIENELFGHAQGAFTDARGASSGLVALAQHGTLFLDEIDTLSARAQASLLRFLQDGSYRAVGATRVEQADVRVVTATNADPEALVRDGRLREDFYYRLAGITLVVPPLRDRRDDILPLARHFLRELNARSPDKRDGRIGETFAAWLVGQDWPGNVRELRNVMERCFVMSDDHTLTPPPPQGRRDTADSPGAIGFRAAKAAAIERFERGFLEQLMRQHAGNISGAARAAGKERKAFDRLLRKHGFRRAAFAP